jgi:hypothetical protein
MHRGLPWSCSCSPASTGAGTGGSSSPCFHVIYHKDARMSHEYQCNAWGVKSDMMHTCA